MTSKQKDFIEKVNQIINMAVHMKMKKKYKTRI